MCGRFALATDKKTLEMLYDMEVLLDLHPRYNIAPSQNILALRPSPATGKRELVYLRWGLVPFWAEDSAVGSRMINARAETVPEKPAFREAFKKRRVVIPASGFFEWKQEEGGKQPYYITGADGRPFSLAGLWERWDKGPEPLETCTILTTGANSLLAPIHDRMPVIIKPQDIGQWIDPGSDPGSLTGLLQPYPEAAMTAYPVSREVNKPVSDKPDLIKPLT